MKISKSIVVGIDFSPVSPNVLRHAAKLAEIEGVPLVAIHVVDSSRMSHRLPGRKGASVPEEVLKVAREKLSALVEAEPVAAGAEVVVATGRPFEEINAVVDARGAGLLVIAANDSTRKRLGLTCSRCVRTAHCDVLVLRDWQKDAFSTIVACVDLSGNTGLVVERGLETAELNGASLHIAHVLYPPERDMWGDTVQDEKSREDFVEHARSHARSALDQAVEPFRDRMDGLKVGTTVLEAEDPAVRLTSFMGEVCADLVILGTRGHSNLGAHFLGTNTERLLQDTPLSVLAVRV